MARPSAARVAASHIRYRGEASVDDTNALVENVADFAAAELGKAGFNVPADMIDQTIPYMQTITDPAGTWGGGPKEAHMSDPLRSTTLHIASELPVGDPTRKKLLAAVRVSGRYRKPFEPEPGDDLDTLIDKAFNCGFELKPNDRRCKWIDHHQFARELIDSYHEGQSRAYEQEDW